jgi:aminomethyltransferase
MLRVKIMILKFYLVCSKDKYKMVLDDQRSLIAIQGPKSVEILNLIINSVADLSFMSGNWFEYKGQKLYVTRSGYTGEDGFEVSISNDLAEGFTKELLDNGAKLIGLGARDTLRLEAGLCLYGHELSTDTTPIEANLKWAISKERLNKGGFIGSDNIINQINDGAKKIRVGIKPEGRLIARENTKIYNENEQMIGEVTSGTFGPSVNGPIAMGFVDQEFSKKETKILLEVRGKKYPANVCGLPFYKKKLCERSKLMSEVKYSKEHEWIKVEGRCWNNRYHTACNGDARRYSFC